MMLNNSEVEVAMLVMKVEVGGLEDSHVVREVFGLVVWPLSSWQ